MGITSPPTTELDRDFLAFWSCYPRRVARGSALKAFIKARQKIDQASLLRGVWRYVQATQHTETRYIAHPASWLNAGRWDDEYGVTTADLSKPFNGLADLSKL